MSRPTMEQRTAVQQRPLNQTQVMHQTWRSLLFLHWEIPATEIQKTLPEGLTVDTFEGKAYVGVVPFFMRNIRPRFFPAIPAISNFLETNVRTYVYDKNGTPGVWFYSLEANQWLAVKTARTFFKLPYFHAHMQANQEELSQPIDYITQRRKTNQTSRFHYQSQGEVWHATPGSFEFFLLERYILFASSGQNRLSSGQVYHTPYPIQRAKVEAWDAELIHLAGFDTAGRPPDHALCSTGVTVDVFPLKKIPPIR